MKFFGTRTRRQSVIDLAHPLLLELNGFRGLLQEDISLSLLMVVLGIGHDRYIALCAGY